VTEAAKYIYKSDSVNSFNAIEKVAYKLPEHPIIPLMEAVFILWKEMPMNTTDSVFLKFESKLKNVISRAQALPKSYEKEGIFFEMSARGLLAEHYANEGTYFKALGEAHKTYGFMKQGFKLVEEAPEFLLTSGLYNYFRVAYPEKHPVYKPLLWFFKTGDKSKGITQLELATQNTIISKVEAHLYLSYIYLRYENNPEKAIYYLEELHKLYPENFYFRAKYIESLIEGGLYQKAFTMSDTLQYNSRPYYQMSHNVFKGIYLEKSKHENEAAIECYKKAILFDQNLHGHGIHYLSWAYLGLGRCLLETEPKLAKEYLLKARTKTETSWAKKEAELLLSKLN